MTSRAALFLMLCLLAALLVFGLLVPRVLSPEGEAGAPGTCEVQGGARSLRAPAPPLPLEGLFWAQEIWISWTERGREGQGYRYPRTREDALALARALCRQAHEGADVGALARKHSNATGGRAYGFAVAPEPSHRGKPDERDMALFRTPVGELTPLLEWRGGFWFARRVDEARGLELAALQEKASRQRARARMITIQHGDSWLKQYEYEGVTHQQALDAAWSLIRRLQAGEDFATLARTYSNDADTKASGGLLWTHDPRTGERTEWIHWGDLRYPEPVVEVILEKARVGEVWHEPVDHGKGVSVVLVLEREE
jgi:hypothetical protein